MPISAGSVDIVAGTGGIIGQDVWATVDEQLHEHASELGDVLQVLVRLKTPVRKGALISDINYEAYPDPGGDDLVWVYAEDEEQLLAWSRIYVQYQEGGLLGEHTYTNDPHQMFLDTAQSDGLEAATAWAELYVNEAIDLCIAGAGVPL